MCVGCAISMPLLLSKCRCICLSFPLHKRGGLDLKQTFFWDFASIATMLSGVVTRSIGGEKMHSSNMLKLAISGMNFYFLIFFWNEKLWFTFLNRQ